MKRILKLIFGEKFLKIKDKDMKSQPIVSVKKILNMINSCQNEEQLIACKSVLDNYVKSAKRSGVTNIQDLQNRLDEVYEERQEELYLVHIFNK